MCNIEGCGCQTPILPYKSHAPGDCFKNQMIFEQTVRTDLCFLSTQQSGKTLAMLCGISPKVTVKRGEKCRRNEALWKFLEMEIVLFKVLISAFRCHCLLLGDAVLWEGIISLWKLRAPILSGSARISHCLPTVHGRFWSCPDGSGCSHSPDAGEHPCASAAQHFQWAPLAFLQ